MVEFSWLGIQPYSSLLLGNNFIMRKQLVGTRNYFPVDSCLKNLTHLSRSPIGWLMLLGHTPAE